MTLDEVRQKYPQYSEIPDAELADKLHQKFYSSMDRAEFDKRIGFSAEPMSLFPSREQFGEAIKNVPGSAASYAGDMLHAVMNPVDTAKAVGSAAAGGLVKGARNLAELRDGVEYPELDMEAPAGAVLDALKQRYGSIEAARQSAIDDPVGVSADVVGLLMGGAGLAPKAATIGRSLEPVTATARTAKAVARAATPEGRAASMYETATKMAPRSLTREQRKAMIQTALDEGVMPTSKGVDRIKDRVGSLNEELASYIKAATDAGVEVPLTEVMRHLGDYQKQLRVGNIDEAKELQAVNRYADEFYKRRWETGRMTMTPEELQEFKVKTYDKINFNAKRLSGKQVKEEFRKTMARGAKDTIQDIIPEAQGINQQLSDLYELLPELQNVANRLDNNNVVSLRDIGNVAAGSVAGGPGGAVAGSVLSVLQSPKAQARMALALHKLKTKDVEWLRENAGSPEVAYALALAGRGEQATSDDRTATQ